MRNRAIVVAIITTLLALPTAAHAATPAQRIVLLQRALTKERAAHTRTRTTLATTRSTLVSARATIAERDTTITTLNTTNAAHAATIAERDAAITALTTARDQALAGLPNAIRAVPLDQFWTLVFTPARETWPCDSYFSSGDYWSLDFTRMSEFC